MSTITYEPDTIRLYWVVDHWFADSRLRGHEQRVDEATRSALGALGQDQGDAARDVCLARYRSARVSVLVDDRVFVTRSLDDRHPADLAVSFPRVADYAGSAVQVSWDRPSEPHRLDDRVVRRCPEWGIYDPVWEGRTFGEVRVLASHRVARLREEAERRRSQRRDQRSRSRGRG